MKRIYICLIGLLAIMLTGCEDESLPSVNEQTQAFKNILSGEWEPTEQRISYYTESYIPGRDTVVIFNYSDLTTAESQYFSGLYTLKVRVSEIVDNKAELITLRFDQDQSYQFGTVHLPGPRWHVTETEGTSVINFMCRESTESNFMQIERLPYTIISVTENELIVGTVCDSQESVFTGSYNVTTGDPVSSNRWCTHTLIYRKVK